MDLGVCVQPWLLGGADLARSMAMAWHLGARYVRCDFAWQDMEGLQGLYAWATYEAIVAEAESRGLSVIACVTQYNAPAWARSGPNWNDPPSDPATYGRFCRALADHFRGRIPYYELGNEPNISVFWQPAPDPDAYQSLLAAGYVGIKAGDSAAQVISAGLAPGGPGLIDPISFTASLFGAPFDVLGAHPYSYPRSPDDDSAVYARLSLVRDLRAMLRAQRRDETIAVTEVGWSTAAAAGGVSERDQSLYTVRLIERLTAEFPFVAIACLYALRDAGTNPADLEDHFGLVTYAYAQKPVYRALR